jgi:long-chain acyl-CoA synthetase
MNREYLDRLKNIVLNLENPNDIENYLPHMTAYEFIYNVNKDRLDSYAMNYLGRRFTFREFFERIDELAKGYRELGVKPNDRVAMSMLSTPEAIFSFYALNKLGATVYMVNGTHEKPGIREEIMNSDASILIVNDILYDKEFSKICDEANITKVVSLALDETKPVGFYSDQLKFKIAYAKRKKAGACYVDDKNITLKDLEELSKRSSSDIKPHYEKGLGGVIAGTSGTTTGIPSHPILSNDSLNASAVQMAMSCTDFEPGDAHLTTLPIWIMYSLFNCVHEVLAFGAEIELDPLFNPDDIGLRFIQYRFNHWNTLPDYARKMSKNVLMKFLDLGNRMKTVTTGGDFRSPKLKMQVEKSFKISNCDVECGQGFGQTQVGGCFGYTYEKSAPALSIGKPIVGNKYKILDDNYNPVGPNVPGNLYEYSPAMMTGYDKDPVKTNEDLVVDENGVKWFNTQDVFYYDNDGWLYMVGRKRRIEQILDANGMVTKYFPDKVKQIISLYPEIAECEVVSIPHEDKIVTPVAYIVLSNKFSNTDDLVEKIKEFCINNDLESYTIPTDFIFVDEIPKKKSLKPDYDKMINDYQLSQKQNQVRKKSIFTRKRS